MNSSKLATHAGITVDLSQIKCFKLSSYNDVGKENTIIIEFKTRYDFIEHPKTGEFIRQDYNEKTDMEFPDYDSANAYYMEWVQIWQDYLDEQS